VLGVEVYGLRFRVLGSGFGVQGSGSRVQGSGFWVRAGNKSGTGPCTTRGSDPIPKALIRLALPQPVQPTILTWTR
jgi:hypothetical protein